jgi:hypothetical protein
MRKRTLRKELDSLDTDLERERLLRDLGSRRKRQVQREWDDLKRRTFAENTNNEDGKKKLKKGKKHKVQKIHKLDEGVNSDLEASTKVIVPTSPVCNSERICSVHSLVAGKSLFPSFHSRKYVSRAYNICTSPIASYLSPSPLFDPRYSSFRFGIPLSSYLTDPVPKYVLIRG